jgi:hypothetical protein
LIDCKGPLGCCFKYQNATHAPFGRSTSSNARTIAPLRSFASQNELTFCESTAIIFSNNEPETGT